MIKVILLVSYLMSVCATSYMEISPIYPTDTVNDLFARSKVWISNNTHNNIKKMEIINKSGIDIIRIQYTNNMTTNTSTHIKINDEYISTKNKFSVMFTTSIVFFVILMLFVNILLLFDK